MKKNQIFKFFLVLFAINPFFQIQLNAENLMDQFDSQESDEQGEEEQEQSVQGAELGEQLGLNSIRAIPKKLLEKGFVFKNTTLDTMKEDFINE